MNIPKYWARSSQSVQDGKGRSMNCTCCGWSNESVADAERKAKDRAGVVARKLLVQQELNRYDYGDLPLREQVVSSIVGKTGKEVAVITRNAYGVLVVNAATTMFIDIDFAGGPGLIARLKRLFGTPLPDPERNALDAVAAWSAAHPTVGMRVYRTCAGMRCIVTTAQSEPTSVDSLAILSELNSDPLYIRLCEKQGCYRARLTPKPWRCGIGRPPAAFPWENRAAEQAYHEWVVRYEKAAAPFSVCRLVSWLGPQEVDRDVAPVLEAHDRLACAGDRKQLA